MHGCAIQVVTRVDAECVYCMNCQHKVCNNFFLFSFKYDSLKHKHLQKQVCCTFSSIGIRSSLCRITIASHRRFSFSMMLREPCRALARVLFTPTPTDRLSRFKMLPSTKTKFACAGDDYSTAVLSWLTEGERLRVLVMTMTSALLPGISVSTLSPRPRASAPCRIPQIRALPPI
jgi:hypothetical protein